MSEFCVLVASSDKGKDIFDLCFAHSERIWRDCDWPRYVGFNSPYPDQYGFQTVTAAPAGWSEQVGQYVDMLPAEIKYILLMVEDTLFMKPVNADRLNDVAWTASDWRLCYLRLVPKRRALLRWPRFSGVFEQILPHDPYYSSTEMALWERGYLCEQLGQGADAWSFEHLTPPERTHWAVWQPVFDQHQIVQKGYWNWDAPRLLAKAGLPRPPPGRPYQSLGARLRGQWQNFNFALFGWTTFKVRRWLSSRSLRRHTIGLIP